ncbi:MAG: HRDC domain-containing protein [Desulfuromonadaceae bacterium]|nr:HRDC domain-containing protein [Desulfuromonadaceae bacterium]MDD2849827.1 HRDC domain-containing protein [Desulfuromonadaceae bacterium]MDD4131598.1 HRDC domain-containing protein [Desulfuromonadaceae bacterium]
MSSFHRQAGTCEIITTMARLTEVAAILGAQKEIAVDLEMDSLHHYREKVCLAQVSTRQQSWLIDPLALPSLTPLAGPLADPEIVVVMHGSDYDIRSLHRDFGIEVTNLFDTMIAARFLGIGEFGLAALLRARFGIELDKKYQKADWSKRPLSREMCAYAVADTSDLLPLYDQFRAELEDKKRLDWLEEEGQLVCQARVSEKDGPLFMYCKGASKLRGHTLAILEELLQLRDRQSELLDRPPFKVLSADTLIEVAECRPTSLHDLSLVKGMTSGQLQRHGSGILAAVEQGLATPESKLPRFPRNGKKEVLERVKERLKRLKAWRERYSAELGLEPGLLAPNWLLEAIADTESATQAELDMVPGMRVWQKRLFGEDLARILTLE